MRIWYLFTPPLHQKENPSDPRQYTLYVVGSRRPSNTLGVGRIYAIKAHPDHEGLPTIDHEMQWEIFTAIQYGCDSEHIILRPENLYRNGTVKTWYHL